MDAAVAEDGEFFSQTYFRDADVGEEIWFLGPVEDGGEGGEDGVIVVGVGAELREGLGDEYIEPV